MLKNVRNYLKEELNCTYELIKKKKEAIDALKKEYDEGLKLKNAYAEKDSAKMSLMGGIIYIAILGIYAPIFTALNMSFGIGILCVLFGGICAYIGFSIKRLVKASKSFKKIMEESEYPLKSFIELSDAFLKSFDRRYEEGISMTEKFIKNNEEYAYKLWEALSSDDFIGMLEKYQEYHTFETALKSEWEAYLEEISHIKPQYIPLEVSQIDKEELKIEPASDSKSEKKLNLAIK